MHALAQSVSDDIRRRELLKAGDRVGVAVSGGIDSVALLRLLLELRGELGIVVSVVHFNHRLRGAESEADEGFVRELARAHDLEFFCDGEDVASRAREERMSVEAAARELRYGFFRHLLSGEARGLKPRSLNSLERGAEAPLLHKITTAHTLDDQAETVVMRMIRGAGMRGLGGIHPRLVVEDDGESCGEIVRPLLETRKRELEQYLKDTGQAWREDTSNAEDHFTRNRIRKLVMPLLENEFNPSVTDSLRELAEIARGEEDYWQNEVSGWMGTGVHWSHPEWTRGTARKSLVQISANSDAEERDGELQARIDSVPWLVMNAAVDRLWFAGEPIAVQRRLIKAVGDEAGIPLEFKHVEQVVRFATENSGVGNELSLPLGWKVVREADEMIFVTPDLREEAPAADYEYDVACPGEVLVAETGVRIEFRRIRADEVAAYNPENLLDADSVPGPFKVRNWRAGDRFWPNHTKSPKKLKELLQDLRVPRHERKQWPVVLCGDEIIWVQEFPVPARLRARADRDAIAIVAEHARSSS